MSERRLVGEREREQRENDAMRKKGDDPSNRSERPKEGSTGGGGDKTTSGKRPTEAHL